MKTLIPKTISIIDNYIPRLHDENTNNPNIPPYEPNFEDSDDLNDNS